MLWILMISLWLVAGGFLAYMDWQKTFDEVDVRYICAGALLGPIMLIVVIPHMWFWRH